MISVKLKCIFVNCTILKREHRKQSVDISFANEEGNGVKAKSSQLTFQLPQNGGKLRFSCHKTGVNHVQLFFHF